MSSAQKKSADQPPAAQSRSVLSRAFAGLERLTAHPIVTLVVLTADLCWVAYSVHAGFPDRAEVKFETLVAATTVAMVFVIQHTQSRQQQASQRKLDEILHALPDADNALLTLEESSDTNLRATGEAHRAIRRAAIDDDPAVRKPE